MEADVAKDASGEDVEGGKGRYTPWPDAYIERNAAGCFFRSERRGGEGVLGAAVVL